MEKPLKPIHVRIIGALIEKQYTTPDQYPMTLNSLKNACNQKTNRSPVVNYHEGEMGMALNELESMNLVAKAWSARSAKFEQRFQKMLDLHMSGVAVMCTLMLRGPQTAGEIRSHTHRIHIFDDIDDAEYVLRRLSEREPALVTQLARQPGQKEQRFAHLLCGEPDIETVSIQADTSQPQSPLEQRVNDLEQQLQILQQRLQKLENDSFEVTQKRPGQ